MEPRLLRNGGTMVIATMESESLSWTALGTTERAAKNALLDGWNTHAAEMLKQGVNVPMCRSFAQLENMYSIYFTDIRPGECKWE